MRIILAVMMFLITEVAGAADCYIGGSIGRSTINYSGIEKLEDRAIELANGYVATTGDIKEKKTSMAEAVHFGCTLLERYETKLRLEVEGVKGIELEVNTQVHASYYEHSADFKVRRLVEAYAFGMWLDAERKISKRTYASIGLGIHQAYASVKLYLDDYDVAIHMERKGFIPGFRAGLRAEFDDRWSLGFKYQSYGIPWRKDQRVDTWFIRGSYALH